MNIIFKSLIVCCLVFLSFFSKANIDTLYLADGNLLVGRVTSNLLGFNSEFVKLIEKNERKLIPIMNIDSINISGVKYDRIEFAVGRNRYVTFGRCYYNGPFKLYEALTPDTKKIQIIRRDENVAPLVISTYAATINSVTKGCSLIDFPEEMTPEAIVNQLSVSGRIFKQFVNPKKSEYAQRLGLQIGYGISLKEPDIRFEPVKFDGYGDPQPRSRDGFSLFDYEISRLSSYNVSIFYNVAGVLLTPMFRQSRLALTYSQYNLYPWAYPEVGSAIDVNFTLNEIGLGIGYLFNLGAVNPYLKVYYADLIGSGAKAEFAPYGFDDFVNTEDIEIIDSGLNFRSTVESTVGIISGLLIPISEKGGINISLEYSQSSGRISLGGPIAKVKFKGHNGEYYRDQIGADREDYKISYLIGTVAYVYQIGRSKASFNYKF